MTLAKHPHQVAQRILQLLQFDMDNANTLGIKQLFYGDQETLGVTPTVCVEAGDTTSPLDGFPNMVLRQHMCAIVVYHGRYEENAVSKLNCEVYGALIADYLDSNLQLKDSSGNDPLVIHGWITMNSPGFIDRKSGKYRAVRLTWAGVGKTRLGA